MRRRRRSGADRGRRRLVLALAAPGLILISYLCLALSPYPELGAFLKRPYSARVLDRDGGAMYVSAVQGIRREWVDLADLPDLAVAAFIRAEDRRFWFHPGVDPISVARALVEAAGGRGSGSGASTIAMQLARMVHPRGKGAASKALEAVDALRLVARLPKRRVLELYLSNLPFGRGAEGLRSAAFAFYGKPCENLDAYESAILAVVPRRPEAFDPIAHPEAASEAAYRSFGTWKALTRGGTEDLKGLFLSCARSAGPGVQPFAAPHFCLEHGLPLANAENRWTVRASIDPKAQAVLERSIRLKAAPYREQRLTNGAGIIIDNRSGEVLAYSGSIDFLDAGELGQNDGVLARNQPGSTLKPFLYAMAFEEGFGPATILPDLPMEFGSRDVYIPLNFNNRYHGPVRLRVALASSLNVPAVYVLERLGVRNFCDYLIGLGFKSMEGQRDSVGVGLAIGNAEVSLLELARAFSALPSGGFPARVRFDRTAKETGAARKGGRRDGELPAIDPYAAALVCSILSDQSSRFLGFAAGETMELPFPAIFKTGTANQYQHVWALAATKSLTVAIWMGNFKGQTIIGRTGSGIPAQAAAACLTALTEKAEDFDPPAGAARARICALSGEAATEACAATLEEFFRPGEAPGPCSYHSLSLGRIVTNYPRQYASWLDSGGRAGELGPAEGAPSIVRPNDGSLFYVDRSRPLASQSIGIEVWGDTSALRLLYDGTAIGLSPEGRALVQLEPGEHALMLMRGDSRLQAVSFRVE
jgi:penicillin-binding protein 1C